MGKRKIKIKIKGKKKRKTKQNKKPEQIKIKIKKMEVGNKREKNLNNKINMVPSGSVGVFTLEYLRCFLISTEIFQ